MCTRLEAPPTAADRNAPYPIMLFDVGKCQISASLVMGAHLCAPVSTDFINVSWSHLCLIF